MIDVSPSMTIQFVDYNEQNVQGSQWTRLDDVLDDGCVSTVLRYGAD